MHIWSRARATYSKGENSGQWGILGWRIYKPQPPRVGKPVLGNSHLGSWLFSRCFRVCFRVRCRCPVCPKTVLRFDTPCCRDDCQLSMYSTKHLSDILRDSRPVNPSHLPEYLSHIRILRISRSGTENPFFVQLIDEVLRAFKLEILYTNGVWEAWSVPTRAALTCLFQSSSLHSTRLGKVHVSGRRLKIDSPFATSRNRWGSHWDLQSSKLHPHDSSFTLGCITRRLLIENHFTWPCKQCVGLGRISFSSSLFTQDISATARGSKEQLATFTFLQATTAATAMNGASQSLEPFIWILNSDFGAHQSFGED